MKCQIHLYFGKFSKKYLEGQGDQHENNLEHLEAARESGLKMIAENNNWVRITCSENGSIMPIETIHEAIYDDFMAIFLAKVKALKDGKKENNGQLRDLKKELKFAKKEDSASAQIRKEQLEASIEKLTSANTELDAKLEQHTALEKELKELKAGIKEAEKKKEDLVEAAREKITPEEAKALIEARFKKHMRDSYAHYLRQLATQLIRAVENLHNKYAITVKDILTEREQQAKLLNEFLVELRYE